MINTSIDELTYFLVDFETKRLFSEQLGQLKEFPEFKLVYFCQEFEAHALKEHQKSKLGGDAYLPLEISSIDFEQMLLALTPSDMNASGNRLESGSEALLKKYKLDSFESLENWKKSFGSQSLDEVFEPVLNKKPKALLQSVNNFSELPDEENLSEEVVMSDKDQDLSLDELGDLEIGEEDSSAESVDLEEGGFDLSVDDSDELSLSEDGEELDSAPVDDSNDFNLDENIELGEESFSLGEDDGEDSLSLSDDGDDALSLGDDEVEDSLSLSDDGDDALSLGDDTDSPPDMDLGSDESLDFPLGDDDPLAAPVSEVEADELSLGDVDLGGDEEIDLGFSAEKSTPEGDLSDDALAKLKEIDEMMSDPMSESLVSDDIDLGGLDLSGDDDLLSTPVEEEVKKTPKKKKEEAQVTASSVDQDIKQIMGSYSGEMERLAATLSNLRTDREELLAKIQKLEEEKLLQNRQNLSLRAELDEKKIELTIIKKKLNEENNELKDRLKIQEEMKLIMDERNRQLQLEVDKMSQKSRLDVKKVQGRERELEQKLELLKADAETQIRHRDHKILELKRRIDGMEFDMESMGHQEKKSQEGKVELEQKLDKAIRTLRGAITILENDSEAAQVLEKLKKNIEV